MILGAFTFVLGSSSTSDSPPIDLDVIPVNGLYLAFDETDPATTLGYGTWQQLGAGFALVTVDPNNPAINAAGKTAGSLTATPEGVVSAPAFTGTQASLTHSGSAVADHSLNLTHSGTAVSDHASHTHTYSQVPNHVHVERAQGGTTASTTGTHLMTSTATGGSLRSSAASTLDPTGGVAQGTTNGPGAALTHSVTQPSAHTGNLSHSVTQPSAHSYTPQGTISAPTFTGSEMSVMQPSIAVFAFRRTA